MMNENPDREASNGIDRPALRAVNPGSPLDPQDSAGGNLEDSPISDRNPLAGLRTRSLFATGALTNLGPFLAGVAAIAAASIGEYIVRPADGVAVNPDLGSATRWCAIGIIILIVGWWGTYQNMSLLHFPKAGRWIPHMGRQRLALIGLSGLANLASLLILRGDWGSVLGDVLWFASLLLLVAALVREPGDTPSSEPAESPEPWRLSQKAEIAVFAALMAFSLGLRLWRLGDLAPGMHGDEGEAGSDALSILQGTPSPLFGRGWFNQPNMYYWSVALGMKIFGTGLFGLRSFALLCGLVTVAVTYFLAREMFGQRAAIVAGAFVAFQSASLEFSRAEFSNASTPALIALAFYFALRGLRTRRHLDFVLSGFASGFSLYFFAGGRLVAPVLVMFFAYLVVARPRFVKHYWSRVAGYVAGLLLISMPWVAYYIAYPINGLQYPNDRFIWYHHADLAAKYGSSAWRTIVWDQLQATLSIITQSMDVSALNALSFPITRPIEAPLIILGLAWAAWRFFDTRFFALSLWFWASIFVAGAITIDAPNLPRILTMLPVLPLVIAAVLDHLVVLLSRVTSTLGRSQARRWVHWAPGAVVLSAFIAIGAVENWQIYIVAYLNAPHYIVPTAQAAYVQKQGYTYRFYGMGAPVIYWTHGDNRFINKNADGIDAGNLSEYLPIADNGSTGSKPANFLVWSTAYDYLPVLRSYYPGAQSHTVTVGNAQYPNQPLIGFVVPMSEINSHRSVGARFVDVTGASATRRQPSLGLIGTHVPNGLRFPVKATWDGSLFADSYGAYRFQIVGPRGTQFTVDGVPGIFPSGSTTRTVVLARGLHAIHLFADIPSSRTPVAVRWATGNSSFAPVPQRALWDDNTVRGWNGDIHSTPIPGGTANPPFLERRVDGFLGFRNAGQLFGPGPLDGHWSSILTAPKSGEYRFRLNISGEVSMKVDGHVILSGISNGGPPQLTDGHTYLRSGRHKLDIRIHWPGPFDYLEAYWSPPGRPYTILLTPNLQPQQPAIWPK
jgi:4-amino-4-deoxy-L-arabinose transferase-like glycosyltransferase